MDTFIPLHHNDHHPLPELCPKASALKGFQTVQELANLSEAKGCYWKLSFHLLFVSALAGPLATTFLSQDFSSQTIVLAPGFEDILILLQLVDTYFPQTDN